MSQQKMAINANKDKQSFFGLFPLALFIVSIAVLIGLVVSGFLLTPFLAIPIILFISGCITGAIWLANRKKTISETSKPGDDSPQKTLLPTNNNKAEGKSNPDSYSEVLGKSTESKKALTGDKKTAPEPEQLIEQQKNSDTPNFDPSEDFSVEKTSSFLKASYGKEKIPDNTFLIWFGKEIPTETKSGKNYLNNVFEHKKKNPATEVSLVISKKLMSEEYYNNLLKQCENEKIKLIDFDSGLKDIPNYDIVLRFLDSEKIKAPEKYILASDVLRFSLLYQFGGRYFDTDLIPYQDYNKTRKENSIYLNIFSIEPKTFGAAFITAGGYNRPIAMDSFIATQKHFLFSLFMTAARYYGEKALDFLESTDEKDDENIMSLIMQTTGSSIVAFGNLLWKLAEDKDAIKDETSQNNDFILGIQGQKAYVWWSGNTRDTTGESVLPASKKQQLFLDNIHQEITESSDQDLFAYVKFMIKKADEYGYLTPTEKQMSGQRSLLL